MVDKRAFFAEHYAYARQAGLTDVQARLAVSQAAVETGWGTEGVAVKGNNFFGLKVGDDWTGKSIHLQTREETKKGKSYTVPADFRQYASPVAAYRDWAKNMEKKWPDVMKATTFNEAVEGLNHGVKGVYATGQKYSSSLKAVNRDLEKSGVIGRPEAAPDLPGISASPFAPGLNAGFGGGLLGKYGDMVSPRTVQTSRVPAAKAPTGPINKPGGFAALAPHGLVGQQSPQNEAVIASLHPAYREQARNFISEANKRGLNLGLVPTTGGYRTAAQQAAIQATGVQAASPRNSFHEYGLGFDFAPLDANNKPSWDKTDVRWDQGAALAEGMGLSRPFDDSDLGHITAGNFPPDGRVPSSIKNDPKFIDPSNGLSYPSLDPQTALRVAGPFNPYATAARSLTDAGLLGIDGRLADPASIVAGAGLRQPDSAFAAPLGQVERARLPDVPAAPFASSFPARPEGPLGSLPAAPHASIPDMGPGYGAQSLEHALARALGLVGPDSLPPDRPMPAGAVRPSLADALASLAPDRQMPSGPVRASASPFTSLPPDRQMPSGAVRPSLDALSASPTGGLWSSLGSTQPNPPIGPDPAHAFAERISAPINTGLVAPATPDSTISGMQIEGGLQRAGLLGMPAGLPSLSAAPSFNSLPPDRMMPSGPVRPTLAPAFAPARTIGVAPNLLSPSLISPVPGTPPAAAIAPTPTAPSEIPGTPTGNFPAAPKAPSAWDKFSYSARPVAKDAMLGMKVAGPLGALGGAAIGLMGSNLPGFGDMVGPGFDAAVPSKDRFSTGFGLPGITSAMGGPKGAQGFSVSNPGMSFTSLGNGMGLRRSERFGWTEVVGPDGSVHGIQYDNPTGGGIFGGLSRAFGSLFGGSSHDATKAEKDSGKYDGPGLW